MKKFVSLLLALSVLIMANIATVSAQGPTGSYISGVSCVDLSGTGATLVVTVYKSADSGGGSLGSFNDSIAAGSNVLYFTGSASDPIGSLMSSNSTGSVVVSSDKEVACSLNTQTIGGTQRVGTSNGLAPEATADKIYVPQALRLYNGSNLIFASYVAVQNAGGSDTTTVTAKFFDASGTEITAAKQTYDIQPNSSHIFYQDQNTALGSSFNGSATFESDDGTPLAGTVVMFDASSTLLTYDAFAGGANTVVGPRFVKNLSGSTLYSGLACQNLSSSATNITADFSIANQENNNQIVTGSVTKSNVGPSQSFLLFANNFAGDSPNAALNAINRGVGSVVVSASGGAEIACTFNENSTTAGSAFNGTGSTYNGVPTGKASTKISFPQVVALGSNSFQGGFQYANTTGTAATCSHTYANTGGVLGTINNKSLAANGSNSIFAPSDMASSGIPAISNAAGSFNGSVTVECDQPIVGIYNLAALPLGGDTLVTNTGVNQ